MENLHNIKYVIFLIVFIFPGSFDLQAATYYVDSSANNDSGNGSSSSPKKYISSGLILMSSSGGDTLLISAGIYSDPKDLISSNPDEVNRLVSGQPGAYNVIKAVTDGTVTITADLKLSGVEQSTASYVQLEGLKWVSNSTKSVVGHHIKIIRCAFEGGPTSGNRTTFGIGTNNPTNNPFESNNILIEDSWFYGQGGRYNLLIFNSREVVVRRVIARHDTGWCFDTCGGSGPPEAGLTVYNSKNILVQNFIVLDSNQEYQYWEGAFYIINNDVLLDNDNTVVEGSLSINNRGTSFKFDGSRPVTNAVIRNSMSFGVGNGISLTGPDGSSSTLQNLSIINARVGVQAGSADSNHDLTNSIITGSSVVAIFDGSAMAGWTHSYNNCSNNNNGFGNNCNDTGETTYDALSNGLVYPTRIELGSTLITSGQGNSPVGANVTLKLGVTGTIYAETGFDAETSDSLWPWPHEDRIKSDMCDEISTGVVDRDWCATNQSLTEYIWGLLGNTPPTVIIGDLIFIDGFDGFL